MVKILSPEEEAEWQARGERPCEPITGPGDYVLLDYHGIPTGEKCRAYRMDQSSGVAAAIAISGVLTREELDAVVMRGSNGPVQATNYHEYCRSLCRI